MTKEIVKLLASEPKELLPTHFSSLCLYHFWYYFSLGFNPSPGKKCVEFEAQFNSLGSKDETKNLSVTHKRAYKNFTHGEIGISIWTQLVKMIRHFLNESVRNNKGTLRINIGMAIYLTNQR